jgi:hypothetical protein
MSVCAMDDRTGVPLATIWYSSGTVSRIVAGA